MKRTFLSAYAGACCIAALTFRIEIASFMGVLNFYLKVLGMSLLGGAAAMIPLELFAMLLSTDDPKSDYPAIVVVIGIIAIPLLSFLFLFLPHPS